MCFIHSTVHVCVRVHGGKSVHAPAVLTALFTVLSCTKAKLSIILLHRAPLSPLPSNSFCLPSIQTSLWFTEQTYNFASWSLHTSGMSGEHLSCCCSCLGWVWPVFQQKQLVAFSFPKRNLTISVVVEVRGWWFARLPSALSIYSFFLWCSSTRFLGLCLEQEDTCFHERDGRWRWKSWNNRLGILSLCPLKEYIRLLEVICVKLWCGADSFFLVYNCL